MQAAKVFFQFLHFLIFILHTFQNPQKNTHTQMHTTIELKFGTLKGLVMQILVPRNSNEHSQNYDRLYA